MAEGSLADPSLASKAPAGNPAKGIGVTCGGSEAGAGWWYLFAFLPMHKEDFQENRLFVSGFPCRLLELPAKCLSDRKVKFFLPDLFGFWRLHPRHGRRF